MTKWRALYQFFNQFNVPAYEENSVPAGRDFPGYPYLVYEVQTDRFNPEFDTSLSFQIINLSESLEDSVTISDSIAEALRGDVVIKIDGGYMRIYRGTPWAQVQRDGENDKVKRLYHTINVAFYTIT